MPEPFGLITHACSSGNTPQVLQSFALGNVFLQPHLTLQRNYTRRRHLNCLASAFVSCVNLQVRPWNSRFSLKKDLV